MFDLDYCSGLLKLTVLTVKMVFTWSVGFCPGPGISGILQSFRVRIRFYGM